MEAAATLPLESWTNFYVIIGSAAGGLTGLTFVVIALVADAHTVRLTGLRAFITPTIIHFCSVLGLSALLNVPGQTSHSLTWCLGVGGVAGLFYSVSTIYSMNLTRTHTQYVPVISDWVWNAVLPTISYLLLACAGWSTSAHAAASLYVVAGVSVLLLLIGIHNAWDIAVWFTAERPETQSQDSKQPPSGTPPVP
jgi:hypothetical protein